MKWNLRLSLFTFAIPFIFWSNIAASVYKDEGNQQLFFAEKNGLKSGPYIGLQGGYDAYSVKDKVLVGDDDIDVFSMNPKLSATGIVGGLFAGYGQYFSNNLYLGAEIFLNATKAETHFIHYSSVGDGLDVDIFETKFRINNSYGISLLPGIKLTPTSLLYARLGWSGASIKTKQILISDAGGTFPDTELTDSFSKSKRVHGFSFGAGMESFLCDNFSIRGDYIHTKYAAFNNYDFFTIPYGSKFTTSENRFMLGLIYHFS